jgi:hypothetical protein
MNGQFSFKIRMNTFILGALCDSEMSNRTSFIHRSTNYWQRFIVCNVLVP